MTSGDEVLIGYFGHHKCATQWMKGLVRGLGAVVGRTVHRYFNAKEFGRDLRSIPEPGSTIVCYTNANVRYVAQVENLRGWHMVRDPRDIVVSSYFSHLHSHPTQVYAGADAAPQPRELPERDRYRATLQSVSKDEGLLMELSERATQFQVMTKWKYNQERVLELRMEEVTADPVPALREITTFVGLFGVNGLAAVQYAELQRG